ncbi:MAG: hypothetical protein FJW79_02570 [Actinobacteria bacterium]|nr:hypothetical protein [Actinomycetota bacterium]
MAFAVEEVHLGVRDHPGQAAGGGLGADQDVARPGEELDRHVEAPQLLVGEHPRPLERRAVVAGDQAAELQNGERDLPAAENHSLGAIRAPLAEERQGQGLEPKASSYRSQPGGSKQRQPADAIGMADGEVERGPAPQRQAHHPHRRRPQLVEEAVQPVRHFRPGK